MWLLCLSLSMMWGMTCVCENAYNASVYTTFFVSDWDSTDHMFALVSWIHATH